MNRLKTSQRALKQKEFFSKIWNYKIHSSKKLILKRILCKAVFSNNFFSKNFKKYILDFYRGNSTTKIKLTLFKQFISFTSDRCQFTIKDVFNEEFEFFFIPSCGWFFFFNKMLKYFPTKKLMHSKTARPEPNSYGKQLSKKKNGQTNKLKIFVVSV